MLKYYNMGCFLIKNKYNIKMCSRIEYFHIALVINKDVLMLK